MRTRGILMVAGLLALCGGSPVCGETVSSDAARATAAGATFTVPAGWAIDATGGVAIVTPPESDAKIALVDVAASAAADFDAAVAAAWAAHRPEFARPLRVATPQAPRNGWEERRYYEYETSPNEKRVVYALVWRAGAGADWTVVLVDSSEATFEKRSGPLNLLIGSLRPKGYQRETFAGKTPHRLDAARIAILRDFIATGMKEIGIPGVGWSLIDQGKVVFEGGEGVRELGKPEPVDADTLFIAASNTKAMTTLLLAQLVDEKKLRWDQPVVEIYPAFKLGDAETTRQVQVRHLICACTGLPRQDMEWLLEYAGSTPSSALQLLGTHQPTSGFGEVFQYSNLMAAAAGYVGAAIALPGRELGDAYDAAMRDRLFLPLGMTRTTFDFATATKGNHARPHGQTIDGEPRLGHMDLNHSVVPVRPAGGVWTSARDLTRYVQMELASGKLPDGRWLVSEANVRARRAPQVIMGEDMTYGMGLMEDKRWGIPIVRHGGDLAGYHSDMIWLPEHGIGATILTNADPGWALRGPFLRRLVEVLFDGKPEAVEQLRAAAAQLRAARGKERERLMAPPDAEAAVRLAAEYTNEALGRVTVTRRGAEVVFDVGEWRSAVASRRNDDGTVTFVTTEPTLDGFTFLVGTRDGRRTLVVRDAQHEYVFAETD